MSDIYPDRWDGAQEDATEAVARLNDTLTAEQKPKRTLEQEIEVQRAIYRIGTSEAILTRAAISAMRARGDR